MFKIVVRVDKHQRSKSSISQTTSIRPEHSSSNAENSFVSNFKIIVDSAGYDSLQANIALRSFLIWNEMNSDANIAGHLSIGRIVNGYQNLTGFVVFLPESGASRLTC